MMSLGIGDKVVFGPEAEFFIFDDVRFTTDMYNTGFRPRQLRAADQSGTEFEMGNLGTARASRAATSPCRPSIAARTSAPKCSRSWPRWA